MRKIDLQKARDAFKKSNLAKSRINVLFPDSSLSLAAAATAAKEQSAEYIELEGFASTPVVNDRGFLITAGTWSQPEAFERLTSNPIVLFCHRQDYPIGQILELEGRPEGLWVRLRIRYNAVLPTQEKIGDVIADGTLRALSIGIDEILEFEVLEADDCCTPIITKVRLGEISIVSVGSDKGAITAVAAPDVADQFEQIFQLASIMDEGKGGFNMWKLLAAKFGMDPEKVTEEQVMTEYKRRETLGASAITGLGLDPNAVTGEQLAAALAARDPKALVKANAVNLVSGAIIAKKIAENDEDTKAFALALAESDPNAFASWLKLQKEVVPDTRSVTAGAGLALGGAPASGTATPYITKEDKEVCLAFGTFTDVAKMDEMAETSPNVALGWVVGQNFPSTVEDKKVLLARRQWDAACGIPAR